MTEMTMMERYEKARQIVEEGPCTPMTTVPTQTLCDYYRVTPKTLRLWVRNQGFPIAKRFGRENVWRLMDVRKHILKQVHA